ncbi:MAG: NAD(P)-dependent alcohol dehydrogenase [Gemmataceae bacterium]|nr:NAD(P)-dependent alcohol dehydrogenase [Gemmataceae bacterium]MDW8242703.1 NAD(P)-dependent alcohol dehydrogenase [Thermogemmata sp.]
MFTVKAYAAASASSPLALRTIPRRHPTERDVQIDILYCGICHSDLHTVRDEWHDYFPTVYPCVPGHEIIGRVTKVGSAVTRFKVGDIVGVGCLVGADHTCPNCQQGMEQFCPNAVFTYNSPDRYGTAPVTYGGYSTAIVVEEDMVLRIPSGLDLAAAAPLLCAGITTYSPLKRNGVGPGKKVGIVGLGGLGHMGVKLARAMGAHVVVFTTSPRKTEEARRLGAHEVVLSSDATAVARHNGTFDMILDCVSAQHDLNVYLRLLRTAGNLTLVGAPEKPLSVAAFPLFMGNKTLAGSMIGGIAETQEMLNFCAQHGITADVELIPIHQVNQAYDRLLRGDVKYRFVLDLAPLKVAD